MLNKPLVTEYDQYRRQFLHKVTAVASVAALAPGLILHEAHANTDTSSDKQGLSNQVRLGLLIDTNKLKDGGVACVKACQQEHGWGHESASNEQQKAQWVRVIKATEKSTQRVTRFPVMCQHCETAPCVDVCPTGASFKRDDGVVLVDKHTCIGCRYCMMACPYKARSFVHEPLTDQLAHSPRGKGTVESCNLCVHRVDEGKLPACVEASEGAIIFGDLNDDSSTISQTLKTATSTQLRADLGLNTGARIFVNVMMA